MAETSTLLQEINKAVSEIVDSSTSAEARAAFSKLVISNVKEVKVPETGKKAYVVVVPYRNFTDYVKPNHARFIAELEKKTKNHICFVAKRDVMSKKSQRPGQRILPYSRTLTVVHNEILKDILGPIEIVGRRMVVKPDGKRTFKVFINLKERTKDNIQEKLPAFGAVYKALTSKNTIFDFADYLL